ncbi:MAG TPA: isocitrate lyase/PEP mutase family protein [Burkholderiales bacterium]|nr:isocitrate lyase/PEP mutase family protein [Burkholderiales bacterium]
MNFRAMLAEPRARIAPAVFNPLCAKIAEAAGFDVLYLSAGALGYVKCCLEANLTLTELAQAGLDIRAACRLPLILDGTCGFGDPMHLHHTVAVAEAAGFCAIEIEDQLLPKRAHHHIGIEHMIPLELMVAKVREAARARRDPDFVIIARTNGVRAAGMDEALRRAEAYRRAGADMLFVAPRNAAEARIIAERLPPPFMFTVQGDGLQTYEGMKLPDFAALGYRILAVTLPTFALHRAMQQTYGALARGEPIPVLAGTTRKAEQAALHETIGLDRLLAVEKATVEK